MKIVVRTSKDMHMEITDKVSSAYYEKCGIKKKVIIRRSDQDFDFFYVWVKSRAEAEYVIGELYQSLKDNASEIEIDTSNFEIEKK